MVAGEQAEPGRLEGGRAVLPGAARGQLLVCPQTEKIPESYAERNRRVRRELPQIFGRYRNLYMMSRRARYCEGFRTVDFHRGHAVDFLDRLEKELPFP